MPGSEAWALGDFSRRSNPPPLGGGEVAQEIILKRGAWILAFYKETSPIRLAWR